VRRATGLSACLATASVLTLAACGVPPSSVIEAGEPAVGMRPAVSVYFVAGDSVLAVPRPGPPGADLTTALRLLFDGPNTAETEQFTTQLPRLPGPPHVTMKGNIVVVGLPPGVGRLTPLATEQVVCTVAANWPARPKRLARLDPAGQDPAGPGGASAAAPPQPMPTSAGPDVHVLGASWEVSGSTDNCP
jgi:hypothetical protein